VLLRYDNSDGKERKKEREGKGKRKEGRREGRKEGRTEGRKEQQGGVLVKGTGIWKQQGAKLKHCSEDKVMQDPLCSHHACPPHGGNR
jgi:hypothetical protein